jgi:hypothetical protein
MIERLPGLFIVRVAVHAGILIREMSVAELVNGVSVTAYENSAVPSVVLVGNCATKNDS